MAMPMVASVIPNPKHELLDQMREVMRQGLATSLSHSRRERLSVMVSECRSGQVEVCARGQADRSRNRLRLLVRCRPDQRSPARSNLPVLPGPSRPNGIDHPERLRDAGQQKKDGVCKDAHIRHSPASPQVGWHRSKKWPGPLSGSGQRQQDASNWRYKAPAPRDSKSPLRLKRFSSISFCKAASRDGATINARAEWGRAERVKVQTEMDSWDPLQRVGST
jgi:hypothetical protein